MRKQVKKAVTKKPVVEVRVDPLPTVLIPENSVVQVDSKGVGDVVEGPAPVATSRAVEAGEAPEPVPGHVVVERAAEMKLLGDQAELIKMAARIAELEAENVALANRPIPADQGQIMKRKNTNKDLVQRTAGGNIRTTFDPSDTFVEEQAAQEVAGS